MRRSMKAFAIKNKEGGYSFAGGSFSKDLCISSCYETIEQCQKVIDYYELKDCEPVEITIAECNLELELTKKDKEIEKLHKALDSQKRHIDIIEQPFRGRGTKRTGNVILDFELSIRKQVCDEIREKLPYFEYSFQEPEVPRVNVIEIRDIEFILDQIEQEKVN